MAIENSWKFTDTIFNSEEFLKNTSNTFRLISQRPYTNKKDPSDHGLIISLQITKDITDYGKDKKTGIQRDNNVMNTFTVTILNKKDHMDIKKGDYVRLINYLPDKSFIIGYELILRYSDVEKINVQTK